MEPTQLDYEIPFRTATLVWVLAAASLALIGFWIYPVAALMLFVPVILLWTDAYSGLLHYALDTPEFQDLPLVGKPVFEVFQTHHFPQWINIIHQKPVIDLWGELNVLVLISIPLPLALMGFEESTVYVSWAFLMLGGCYAQLCHRWAHLPAHKRSRPIAILQRTGLAISPRRHWAHHQDKAFSINFSIACGWSNAFLNRVFRVLPNRRFWLVIFLSSSAVHVVPLAYFLKWLADSF